MKLLIIEDDRNIVSAVKLAFQVGWPGVEMVSTDWGQEGIKLVETESPDAVLLDLGLPDINGLDVIKAVRVFSKIPILVLSVHAEETYVVQALELGANEYVFKPFRQMELLTRVKRMLTLASQVHDVAEIIWGSFSYFYDNREIVIGAKRIRLRGIENEILHTLITHSPDVVTYSSLTKAVWGDDYEGAMNCLKVHISHLREKVEDNPSQPRIILTRSGVGYYMAKP